MQDIGFAVPGNQVESPRHSDGFFVKVNAKNLQHMVLVGGGDLLIGEQISGQLENGVHRKAATAGRGVNHVFAAFGVEHLHAHVNHMAGREILPLFAFGGFIHQIFKGFVHHQQIGVEQLDILQAGNADGHVAFRQCKS